MHVQLSSLALNVHARSRSFIMMNQRARPDRNVNGSVTQTLDVLDFSIIHLSWYERLQKRHSRIVRDALLKKHAQGSGGGPDKDEVTLAQPDIAQ